MHKYFQIIYETLSDTICILVVMNGIRPAVKRARGQQKLWSSKLWFSSLIKTVKWNQNSCASAVQVSVSENLNNNQVRLNKQSKYKPAIQSLWNAPCESWILCANVCLHQHIRIHAMSENICDCFTSTVQSRVLLQTIVLQHWGLKRKVSNTRSHHHVFLASCAVISETNNAIKTIEQQHYVTALFKVCKWY